MYPSTYNLLCVFSNMSYVAWESKWHRLCVSPNLKVKYYWLSSRCLLTLSFCPCKNSILNFQSPQEIRKDSPSPQKGKTMTIIEKNPSMVQSPSPSRSRVPRRDLDKPARKDGDLLSSATSALRRLHFKSAGSSRTKKGVSASFCFKKSGFFVWNSQVDKTKKKQKVRSLFFFFVLSLLVSLKGKLQ